MNLRRRRRAGENFGLSFLDVICCGFGAIILLFIISMGAENQVIQNLRTKLQELVQQRLSVVAQLRTEETIVSQQAQAAQDGRRREEDRARDLQALIDNLMVQIQYLQAGRQALLVDVEQRREEIDALQKKLDMPLPEIDLPVGLPIVSNYVAFVIDTSGSMRDPNTGRLLQMALDKMNDLVSSYPVVRGVQFLDADGRFIVRGSRAEWISDSPEVRADAMRALHAYPVFSNSNPVPGIVRAIRTLHDPNNPEMRMAVFVVGDEFTGTADPVINRLEEINPRGEDGRRPVSINAIGIPAVLRYPLSPDHTGMKFAHLMREICYRHDGAFIAVR